ncbi:MAG TPA: cobyrinate a,c-diamide synthase [Nitrospiria bacterium]|nr:cobyrinate a,c-diamide synthase [Nitrospiria bacterium]
MKGFIIAAAASGAGKTTVSMGLMAAFKKRGFICQPFKVGPDFIDPGYHSIVCGRPSINLDSWMMPKKYVIESFWQHSEGADIAIIEGVMGLLDGGDASSAEIARILDLPVILVLDAGGMAETAGAILYGLNNYDKSLNIAGAILNRVGSDIHYKMISEAISGKWGAELFGYIRKDEAFGIKERHLGLVTAIENRPFNETIEQLIRTVEEGVDLDAILKAIEIKGSGIRVQGIGFRSQQIDDSELIPTPRTLYHTKKVRLAVAYDEAFSFYYQDNLDMLEARGAEICRFSPLKDQRLPEGIKGIYIGGGYPEVYAEILDRNMPIKEEVRKLAEDGLPIYAECGGMIYLSQGILSVDGTFYKMAGIIPKRARMEKKLAAIGYREVELLKDCILGRKGNKIRGHEFHYSRLEGNPHDYNGKKIEYLYQVTDRRGSISVEGFGYKNLVASYIHLHFASNTETAASFIGSLFGRMD